MGIRRKRLKEMLPEVLPDLSEEQWKQVKELAEKPDTQKGKREREKALRLVKKLKHK